MKHYIFSVLSVILFACNNAAPKGETPTAAAITPVAYSAPIKEEEKKEEPTSILVVSANKLWSDYHKNEVAADSVYNENENGGKSVIIIGTISKIAKNYEGTSYLAFPTPNRFQSAFAYIDANSDTDTKSFVPGNKVVCSCLCVGLVTGSPMLSECACNATKLSDAEYAKDLQSRFPNQSFEIMKDDVVATSYPQRRDNVAIRKIPR